jgi:hypothetical protein
VSYISSDADLSGPRHQHAWRAEGGTIHATVRLSENNASTLYFDSAADARAVAAACIEAAEALDRLAEEIGQAAADITAPQPEEPAACSDHRPVLDSAVGWYCPACGSDAPPDGSETSGGAR